MLAVRKDLGLMRQIGATAVDKVEAGQTVLARNFLRPQVLLYGHRKVGATLDGGIVADDDTLTAFDASYARDQPRAVDRLVIHLVSSKRRQLQERRPVINQIHDTVAWQQLPAGHMALP